MEQDKKDIEPDKTAVRTALWRALHVEVDDKPYLIEDEIGLKLIAPPEDWQERPDMKYTRRLRASVIARSRFVEDLITEQSLKGISQYVILGAGLDTFAQRRADIAAKLQIYEIDQQYTLEWKQKQLIRQGFGVPDNLHFVIVDFETSSWWDELLKAGFDTSKPAVVTCAGVSLYLTKEAITSTINKISTLAPGSTLAMAFYLPMELLDIEDQPMQEIAEKGAAEDGTPFVSFFTTAEILALGCEANFKEIKAISTKDMEKLYFAERTDNLLPASGEILLLATTQATKLFK